jgi:hypothetical protein
MTQPIDLKGACLCGEVKVTARSKSSSVGACHCNICRGWGGGPLLAIECGADVKFDGEAQIKVFNSSDWAERGFCSQCGTHLFYRLKEGGLYALPAGLFGEQALVFDHQVFIDEKPGWYDFSNTTKNLTGAELFAAYSAPE